MCRYLRWILASSLIVMLTTPLFAQTNGDMGASWVPADPVPGDSIKITFDATLNSEMPNTSSTVYLWWGVNTNGNVWTAAPEDLRPPNSSLGDNAVKSRMVSLGNSVFTITLHTDDRIDDIQFVFTDGSKWAHGANNSNWHIYLTPPPPPPPATAHRFVFDPRGTLSPFHPDEVTDVSLKGTFNNWGDTPMTLDPRGFWYADMDSIPSGPSSYKFYVTNTKGVDPWISDPDNPYTDGGSTGNSYIELAPNPNPYVLRRSPGVGENVQPGSDVSFSVNVSRSDTSDAPITTYSLKVDGNDLGATYASQTLTATLPNISSGFHRVDVFLADDNGAEMIDSWTFVADPGDGVYLGDLIGDDHGTGSFKLPAGTPEGAADLVSVAASPVQTGDSLLFTVRLDTISDRTRVVFQITGSLNNELVDDGTLSDELQTPDWQGTGAQILLVDPNSTDYDSSVHNRWRNGRDPSTYGNLVDLNPSALAGNVFEFRLAMSDLEDLLGSFNRDWFFSVYTLIGDGSGPYGIVEPDSLMGGTDLQNEPDVYDVITTDGPALQNLLLSNWSVQREAKFDNFGRGFAVLDPDSVGGGVGATAWPVASFLSRPGLTVQDHRTLQGTVEIDTAAGSDPVATITLHQTWDNGDSTYASVVTSHLFHFDVPLYKGNNTFYLTASQNGDTTRSPALVYPRQNPQVPIVNNCSGFGIGTGMIISVSAIDPQGSPLAFQWTAAPENPQQVSFSGATNTNTVQVEKPSIPGEYYLNVAVSDEEGNTTHARTMFWLHPDGSLEGFDVSKASDCIDSLIVYEIYPRAFVPGGKLRDIAANLYRVKDLGANAVWLTPIFEGPSDHGYEISDYYHIEQDFGTIDDFKALVDTAHALGLKVILDLVINHTSIQHPFARDGEHYGKYSHYYDYYMRNVDGSLQYYYDWASMPNLNYGNPDVYDYFLKVSEYWMREFDIDGYRCDVAWGVEERKPQFWVDWRKRLKLIKPECFLLAEASSEDMYILGDRFDSAYDWNLNHESSGSFKSIWGTLAVNDMDAAITRGGSYYPAHRYPFRYLSNHDEARYLQTYGRDKTLEAAALLYLLPGVPLVYNGEEVGVAGGNRDLINWDDPEDYFSFYAGLLQARRELPSLHSPQEIQRLTTNNSTVYSFARQAPGHDPVIGIYNFNTGPVDVTVQLTPGQWGFSDGSSYYLNNLMVRDSKPVLGSELDTLSVSLPKRGFAIYTLSDSSYVLGVPERRKPASPLHWTLYPNYPNPFNPTTQIRFDLPKTAPVKLTVYNILGQQVRSLVDKTMQPGSYTVMFDGRSSNGTKLASGVYFFRLEAGQYIKNRKMVLLK